MVTRKIFEEQKKKFLNCWCNYKGLSFIKDWTHCWLPYTYCKQCWNALTQVNHNLTSVKLYNTKIEAKKARDIVFCMPEEQLLNSLIPWIYNDKINQTMEKLKTMKL